jgi:hypothetical protein
MKLEKGPHLSNTTVEKGRLGVFLALKCGVCVPIIQA